MCVLVIWEMSVYQNKFFEISQNLREGGGSYRIKIEQDRSIESTLYYDE